MSQINPNEISWDDDEIVWDDEPKQKRKTSFEEDVKNAIANVGNMADTAWTLMGEIEPFGIPAKPLIGTKDYFKKPGETEQDRKDRVYKNLNERIASRNDFGRIPDDAEQSFWGKLTGLGATLPAQALTWPLSPYTTGKDFIDAGEDLNTARGAVAIDTVGNTLGMVNPAFGGLPAKIASNFATQATQDAITKKALSSIATDETLKQQYSPSLESVMLSGVAGSVLPAMTGGNKKAPKPPTNKIGDLEAEVLANKPMDVEEKPHEVWTPSQLKKYVEIQERFKAFAEEQKALERQQAAQEALNARQAALEQEVARQQSLDFNAAERARQEAAPTGYQEYLSNNRKAFDEKAAPIAAELDALQSDMNKTALDSRNAAQEQMEAVKQKEAQEQLQKRQTELELEVARQHSLDFNAAERARQEAAPTGYAQWVEKQRQNALIEAAWKKKQGGGINLEAFEEGFTKIKQLAGGVLLKATGMGDSTHFEAFDKAGNKIGELKLGANDFVNPSPEGNASSLWTNIDPAHRGTGLVDELYKFGSEVVGDITPAKVQTDAGRNLWDRFEKQGLSNKKLISQRGAINLKEVSDGVKKLMGLSKDSPEVQQASNILKREKNVALVGTSIPGLDEYRNNIDTPEKVIASLGKDITPLQKLNAMSGLKPGIRKVVESTNHPLLKFVSNKVASTFNKAAQDARTFITSKDGAGTLLTKLSDQEAAEVHAILHLGDRERTRFSTEQLARHGFNEKQIALYNKIQAMEDYKLNVWNENLLATGQKPVKPYQGHWPGIFKGDYRSLVLDENGHIIGFIGEDTKWKHNAVVNEIKKQFPKATITEVKRSRLGGSRVQSDVFSGAQELLEILAKDDPRLAQIQQAIEGISASKANDMYGASKHALDKKGIWGNEGNKPWQKDAQKAAKEAFRAYFSYWEEGILSHRNMPVEAEIRGLLTNPELDSQPNAKAYVDEYLRNMTGRGTGDVGAALNTLVDLVPKLIGVGPSYTKETVNQINKRMGQKTQGFMNMAFTAMQFLQIPQTAMPRLAKTAGALGISDARIATSLAEGSKLGLKLAVDSPLNSFEQRVVEEARARGLLEFSEFEEVHKVTQNKYMRKFDNAVDWNRKIGESGTRPLVFFSFVDMLKKGGFPEKEIFDTAYNLTQTSMYDYSARERPLGLKKLGVVGNLAGSLTTFKYNYADDAYRWAVEAAKGNPKPLLYATLATGLLSGINGLPWMEELDGLTRKITGLLNDKPETFQDIVMRNLDVLGPYRDIFQYGALSDLIDADVSSRMGAGAMLPDSPLNAITPWAKSLGNMGESLADVVNYGDSQAAKNFALDWSPSSVRGLVQDKLFTDKEGMVYNKENKPDIQRTGKERLLKTIGLTSLEESKAKKKMYREDLPNTEFYKGKRQSIMQEVTRQSLVYGKDYTSSPEFRKALKEYEKYQGDPSNLITAVVKAQTDKHLTTQQRMQGQADSIEGIYRYKEFND